MSALTALSLIVRASQEHHEVDSALSWGIGAVALGILLAMLFVLMSFGKGREHS